jgi:hypothetical protein
MFVPFYAISFKHLFSLFIFYFIIYPESKKFLFYLEYFML